MVEIFPEELTLRPSAFFGGFWFKDAEFEPIMDSCLRFSLTLIYTQPQTWACHQLFWGGRGRVAAGGARAAAGMAAVGGGSRPLRAPKRS